MRASLLPLRPRTLGSAFATAVVIAGAALLFRASPIGLALQGARDDPVAARSLGIRVVRVRLAGWALSALLMGGAGALWAQNSLAFGPDPFYFDRTFTLLSMLVIGSIASVSGAVAGAAIVVVAGELLRNVEEGIAVGPIEIPGVQGAVQLANRRVDHGHPRLSARRGAREPRARRARTRPAMTGKLEAVDVKSFSGVRALAGVTLRLETRALVGLIGPNGSGKTTRLNVVSGLLAPDRGRVLLDGADVSGSRSDAIARAGVVRTFQTVLLVGSLSARENVELAVSSVTPPRAVDDEVDGLLELLDLARWETAPAAALPYGVRRRLELARARDEARLPPARRALGRAQPGRVRRPP